MNHDSKYNDFEYEQDNFPKTADHFKQLVAAQVEKELKQTSVEKHRPRKKWFPAKVAAAVIVCAVDAFFIGSQQRNGDPAAAAAAAYAV